MIPPFFAAFLNYALVVLQNAGFVVTDQIREA